MQNPPPPIIVKAEKFPTKICKRNPNQNKFSITCKIDNLNARLDMCYHPRGHYESKKWNSVLCAYKFIVGKISQRVLDRAHHPHY